MVALGIGQTIEFLLEVGMIPKELKQIGLGQLYEKHEKHGLGSIEHVKI